MKVCPECGHKMMGEEMGEGTKRSHANMINEKPTSKGISKHDKRPKSISEMKAAINKYLASKKGKK